MKMQKDSWVVPKTIILWGLEWADAELSGAERLMFLFLLQYANKEDREFVFEMQEFEGRYEKFSDLYTGGTVVLKSLADKGYIYWKTFRHLGQEWHSVTIAQKGRDLCAG